MPRLTLRREHLTALTADELGAVAGAADDSFTGRIDCALSFDPDRCVSVICIRQTLLCGIE